MAITWAALPIGAVKASVLATVVTTTLAYFANRYWTYRNHTRTALRREYMLFFGFNLVGMVIQSGAIAIGKYGFGLTERHDELALLGVTGLGVVIGTVFRFWAYRTFVFLKPPVDGHEAELADLCGVSRFSIREGEDFIITIADLKDEPRCERSWKRDGTVRERSDGGFLSDRDAKALGLS